MSNIIEEFYYGNIEPQKMSSELSAKLKKKSKKLTAKEEQLNEKLNNKEKELFLNYANAYSEFSSLCNADSFISGFRLGARFTYEMFFNNATNS